MQLADPAWEVFAQHYVGGASKTEAARRAGFAVPGNQGSRLSKHPKVAQRIEELRRPLLGFTQADNPNPTQDSAPAEKPATHEYHVSREYVINKFVETYELAKAEKQLGVCATTVLALARIGKHIDASGVGRQSTRTTTNITFNVNELNATLKAQFDEVSPSERQRLLEANPELAELMGVKIVDVASEPGGDETAW